MNEHLSEIKIKINEEINHRTYSPLLFFTFVALVVEHYEIVLYLLDSSLTSVEKISEIESYWKAGHNIYKPLFTGGVIFLIWCFIHPISSLIWDLIKRSIIWVRKTKIHRIPVIPEVDYEALKDEYNEERKRLNLEHSDMVIKVESIKSQLESSKDATQRNKEEIARIKEQFSSDKERLLQSNKDEITRLIQSSKSEVEQQNRRVSTLQNDLDHKTQEVEATKKDLLKLKLENFDKDNWKDDSSSFRVSGFRWRISFDYLPPSVEEQIINFFSQDNIQFQKNMSNEFSFVWVKGNKENPKDILYKKGVDYISIRDLEEIQ